MDQIIEKGNEAVVTEHALNGFIKYETFMGNIHKNYFQIFGKENFQAYLDVLKIYLSENFQSPKKHIKASYMDLLFTLNIMEKGRIVGEILQLMRSEKEL